MVEDQKDIDEAFLAWESHRQKASEYGFAAVRDALSTMSETEILGAAVVPSKDVLNAYSQAWSELREAPSLEALEVLIRQRREHEKQRMNEVAIKDDEHMRAVFAQMHATDLLDECYNILHAGFASSRGIPMKTVAEFVRLISSMDAAAEMKEHVA